jgi:hypothetical protein
MLILRQILHELKTYEIGTFLIENSLNKKYQIIEPFKILKPIFVNYTIYAKLVHNYILFQ